MFHAPFCAFSRIFTQSIQVQRMIELSGVSDKFTKISQEEWIQLIEKELKNTSWEALQVRINERISTPPGLLSQTGPELNLKRTRPGNTWTISEFFLIQDNAWKTALMNALNFGLEAPFLFAGAGSKLDESLWEGVITDYVEPMCFQAGIGDFERYMSLVRLHMADSAESVKGGYMPELRDRETLQTWMSICLSKELQVSPEFKFFHIAPAVSCDPAEPDVLLADILMRLAVLAELGGLSVFKRAMVSVPVGDSMMTEIAKLRALRLLIYNIWIAKGGQMDQLPGVAIHTFNDPATFGEDENKNRIKASLQGLSMVWGLSDYISVLPGNLHPAPEDKQFNRRIARNLNHLYRYESYLEAPADMLQGSCVLEDLSRKMADNALRIFTMRMEDLPGHPSAFPMAVSFSSDSFGSF
jgi:methylmalonyl-CoA mutase